MLPGTNQLLATSGRDPNIGVAEHVVGHEISCKANGEGEYDNQGVGTGVGEPNVITKILHVRGKARVQVGTGFGGHGAVGHHGRPCPGVGSYATNDEIVISRKGWEHAANPKKAESIGFVSDYAHVPDRHPSLFFRIFLPCIGRASRKCSCFDVAFSGIEERCRLTWAVHS
jgi:hypothetical protein